MAEEIKKPKIDLEEFKKNFKEKKQSEILAMTEEEQKKYFKDLKLFSALKIDDLKKSLDKKQEPKRKKINHATFLMFGELLKYPEVRNIIKLLPTQSNFTDEEKKDLNLLLAERGFSVRFKISEKSENENS